VLLICVLLNQNFFWNKKVVLGDFCCVLVGWNCELEIALVRNLSGN